MKPIKPIAWRTRNTRTISQNVEGAYQAMKAAQRLLLDCLNEDRPAKLSPEQVLLILRLSRERGFHAGIAFVLESLHYGPTVPIEPKDEAADLMRQVMEGQRLLAIQLERLTALQPQANQLRAVA